MKQIRLKFASKYNHIIILKMIAKSRKLLNNPQIISLLDHIHKIPKSSSTVENQSITTEVDIYSDIPLGLELLENSTQGIRCIEDLFSNSNDSALDNSLENVEFTKLVDLDTLFSNRSEKASRKRKKKKKKANQANLSAVPSNSKPDEKSNTPQEIPQTVTQPESILIPYHNKMMTETLSIDRANIEPKRHKSEISVEPNDKINLITPASKIYNEDAILDIKKASKELIDFEKKRTKTENIYFIWFNKKYYGPYNEDKIYIFLSKPKDLRSIMIVDIGEDIFYEPSTLRELLEKRRAERQEDAKSQSSQSKRDERILVEPNDPNKKDSSNLSRPAKPISIENNSVNKSSSQKNLAMQDVLISMEIKRQMQLNKYYNLLLVNQIKQQQILNMNRQTNSFLINNSKIQSRVHSDEVLLSRSSNLARDPGPHVNRHKPQRHKKPGFKVVDPNDLFEIKEDVSKESPVIMSSDALFKEFVHLDGQAQD